MTNEELTEKLLKLEELHARSLKISNIEETVYNLTQKQRREHLIEALVTIMKNLIKRSISTRKQIFQIEHGVLIDTFYHEGEYKGLPIGYIALQLADSGVIETIRYSKEKWKERIDTPAKRLTYLEELQTRVKTLIDKIREGHLDQVLGTPPYKILHMINGRHGELLGELGIDPEKGITQQIFKENVYLKRI